MASNRRIVVDGKVKFTRTSATKDEAVRKEPEGLVDPFLRTLSFWDKEKPVAALHTYACHPMSYYGDGRVSADFCGLARQKLQDEDKDVFQVYFNGCGGNVTAGKYNDGSKANRVVLRDRMYKAMVASVQGHEDAGSRWLDWRFEPVKFLPRKEPSFGEEASRKALEDPKQTAAKRNNAAYQLAWLKRADTPIELNCLDFGGKVLTLFLPGEAFIEYQLAAPKMRRTPRFTLWPTATTAPDTFPPPRRISKAVTSPRSLSQSGLRRTDTQGVEEAPGGRRNEVPPRFRVRDSRVPRLTPRRSSLPCG